MPDNLLVYKPDKKFLPRLSGGFIRIISENLIDNSVILSSLTKFNFSQQFQSRWILASVQTEDGGQQDIPAVLKSGMVFGRIGNQSNPGVTENLTAHGKVFPRK